MNKINYVNMSLHQRNSLKKAAGILHSAADQLCVNNFLIHNFSHVRSYAIHS